MWLRQAAFFSNNHFFYFTGKIRRNGRHPDDNFAHEIPGRNFAQENLHWGAFEGVGLWQTVDWQRSNRFLKMRWSRCLWGNKFGPSPKASNQYSRTFGVDCSTPIHGRISKRTKKHRRDSWKANHDINY